MDYGEANLMQWAITDSGLPIQSLKDYNEYGEYFVDAQVGDTYYRLTNWCEFGLLIGALMTNNMSGMKQLIPADPINIRKAVHGSRGGS